MRGKLNFSALLLGILLFSFEYQIIISYSYHTSIRLGCSPSLRFNRATFFASSLKTFDPLQKSNARKNFRLNSAVKLLDTVIPDENLAQESTKSSGILKSAVQFLKKSFSSFFPEPQITYPLNTGPYAIFVNRKSGGKQGKRVLNNLKMKLLPQNYCDILRTPTLKKLLELHRTYGNQSLVVCCGGDGTIRWIMDEANELKINEDLTYCLIPLGTGNDLVNHVIQTNYNSSSFSTAQRFYSVATLLSPTTNFSDFSAASVSSHKTVSFDRWNITVLSSRKREQISKALLSTLHIPKSINQTRLLDYFQRKRKLFNSMKVQLNNRKDSFLHDHPGLNPLSIYSSYSPSLNNTSYSSSLNFTRRSLLIRNYLSTLLHLKNQNQNSNTHLNRANKNFNNYFGIGIDGMISHRFDTIRKRSPNLFVHSLINKILYFLIWVVQTIFHKHQNLVEHVEIICDGAKIDLSQFEVLQGIVLTNIDSYAGGCRLWHEGYDLLNNYSSKLWKEQSSNDSIIEVSIIFCSRFFLFILLSL
jgi:hypothetical protein